MKCNICPLFHQWDTENDHGEDCAIFGDGWDSPFQYENKEGTTVGCYLDKHYIVKVEKTCAKYYASMAEHFVRDEVK